MHRAILGSHVDGVLHITCDLILNGLCGLLWLRINVWHSGLAHWQVDEVVVVIRGEGSQRLSIEVDHLEVGIARAWYSEIERIGVGRYAICCCHGYCSRHATIADNHRLTLRVEASCHLW